MEIDHIEIVEIDSSGRLHLKPGNSKFPMIYRSAAGLNWDSNKMTIHSTIPKTMNYLEWFVHILNILETEADTELIVNELTQWINVSEDLKSEILSLK